MVVVKEATNARYKFPRLVPELDRGTQDFLSGCFGGMGSILASQPLDVIRVRMQTIKSGEMGMAGCAKTMIQEEGPFGFYKGVAPPLIATGFLLGIVFAARAKTEVPNPPVASVYCCLYLPSMFNLKRRGTLILRLFSLAALFSALASRWSSFVNASELYVWLLRGFSAGAFCEPDGTCQGVVVT